MTNTKNSNTSKIILSCLSGESLILKNWFLRRLITYIFKTIITILQNLITYNRVDAAKQHTNCVWISIKTITTLCTCMHTVLLPGSNY